MDQLDVKIDIIEKVKENKELFKKILEAWFNIYPPEKHEKFTTHFDNDIIYYVENDNNEKIIAMGIISEFSPTKHVKEERAERLAYLYNLIVINEFQHKGIGKKLINFICNDIKNNDKLYSSYWRNKLHIDIVNPSGDINDPTKFYTSLGFRTRENLKWMTQDKIPVNIKCMILRFSDL